MTTNNVDNTQNVDDAQNLLNILKANFDHGEFTKLAWTGTFNDYLNMVSKNPVILANAWKRIYQMIISFGKEEKIKFKKKLVRYKFFSSHPQFPIFGLEETIMELVDTIHAGSMGYGPERRILLLHGPVGSSKSTICSRLKRGLEEHSRTDEGALYTYSWNLEGTELAKTEGDLVVSALNEEPLNLLPVDIRKQVVTKIMEILPEDERFKIPDSTMNARCQLFFDFFMKEFDGKIEKVLDRIVIQRFVFDEKLRKGIATFQPRDEKNQDATELTGDINFRKLGQIGIDSDPRCFNFDGEFQIANRGLFEVIEMLKLSKEFLYDMLGASQEKQIKPKKFSQMYIDEVIIGHTNGPEFEKLQKDKTMEALRDRTIRIDVPYLLTWDEEYQVYQHHYNSKTVRQHIAPHTLEIAALWSVLTRLNEVVDGSITVVEKAKLYNGQALPGWTEDKVRELKDNSAEEGMSGISARFVQNAISNVLVGHREYINAFMVLKELRERLAHCSLIDNEDDRKRYGDLVAEVTKEYDEIIKDEVQKALVGDEAAIERLCSNYIDNIVAFVDEVKIENPITGRDEEPNERLMRSIEEKVGISEQQVSSFRRSVVMMIGSLSQQGKQFDYRSNVQLMRALKLKLFEDTKDTVKLAKLSYGSETVDEDTQSKIDTLKRRLIDNYGYNDQSASDILHYASSIFARGDTMED